MAGHDAILQWPRETFDAAVDAIEVAFINRGATFYFNTEVTAHTVDVFDRAKAGFDPHLWRKVRSELAHFDQFFVFAFEGAPESVIRTWGDEHGLGLADEAVTRVAYLKQNAPSLARQWRARATTANYALGDLHADLVINPMVPGLQLLLRLDTFIPGAAPRRLPIGSSRNWMSFVVDTNEVERLIARLQYFQGMLNVGDDDEEEDVDADADALEASDVAEEEA